MRERKKGLRVEVRSLAGDDHATEDRRAVINTDEQISTI